MSFAANGGVRVHYRTEGPRETGGPPLVLQHGFSYDLEDWHRAGYVDALKRDRRLILIDARGHGLSDKPHDPAAYTNEAHVADVLAVLDAEGIERTDYLGFSMGGWIGFGLAIAAPERLHSIVITGSHPYGRAQPTGVPDGSDPGVYMDWFFQRIGLDFRKLPAAERERFLANDCRALAAAQTARPSMEKDLDRMTMPCLLLAGDREPVFEQAKKCVASIPHGRFVTLPGFDHGETFGRADVIVPHVTTILRRP
jgi:pimeloyl-ACP methyl ester carboxylesterase